jgi:hypothetical protein
MQICARFGSFLFLAAVPLLARTVLLTSPQNSTNNRAPAGNLMPSKEPIPTVFQADEGDRWMLIGIKSLIFKVDPVTTGSDADGRYRGNASRKRNPDAQASLRG